MSMTMIPHLLDNRDNVCKLLAVCLAHIKHFVIAIITNRHLLIFHWLKNKKRKNLSREAFAKEGKARGLQIAKSFEPHWPQNPGRHTFCPSGFHRSSRVPRAPAHQHPQHTSSYTALRAEVPTQTTAEARGSPEGEALPHPPESSGEQGHCRSTWKGSCSDENSWQPGTPS